LSLIVFALADFIVENRFKAFYMKVGFRSYSGTSLIYFSETEFEPGLA